MENNNLKKVSDLAVNIVKFIDSQDKLPQHEIIALCVSLSCLISRESQDIEEAKILSGICLSNVNKFLELSMKSRDEKETIDEHEQ